MREDESFSIFDLRLCPSVDLEEDSGKYETDVTQEQNSQIKIDRRKDYSPIEKLLHLESLNRKHKINVSISSKK